MYLYLLIIIVLILIFIGFRFRNSTEHFAGESWSTEPLKEISHVIVGKQGEPLLTSPQQPSGNGINGCAVVPCPKTKEYDDRTVCWCCCNYDDSSYQLWNLI